MLDSYRYGFQGQEKDDEVKGEGNSVNYKFRMHDPRVGRFFAVDPLTHKYPWYTPYQFSGNKVIQFAELEGLEEFRKITNRDWLVRLYKVRPEDNLNVISKVTGVAVNDIIRFNPGIQDNPDHIEAGQVLTLRDISGLTMADFVEVKQSSYVKDFTIELATTNENGPSIQSQANFVFTVEAIALGANIVINGPKAIRALIARRKAAKQNPKIPVKEVAPKIETLKNREIIVDENLSPKVAENLKNEGYTVKVFKKGTLDPDIITYARENKAVVITNNIKDFKGQDITTIEVSSKLVSKQNIGNVVNGVKNISAYEAEAFGQGLFGKNANIKLEGFISPKPLD